MGKAKRLKQLKKEREIKKMAQMGGKNDGLKPLTDDLIEKLAKEKGIPIKDLKKLQRDGAKYSENKGSFFFPPEINFPQ
nr:hypothetical protein [uncultured Desulfobacter sp.]